MAKIKVSTETIKSDNSFLYRTKKDFIKNKTLYLMVLPVMLYFIIFKYGTMYGAIIAFKNYSPANGIFASEWCGLTHFKRFFSSIYFGRVIKNTFLISFYSILWGFPAPIILALLLNEVKKDGFKRSVQTMTYLPHFISLVVIVGMVKDFTITDGLINDIIVLFGGERIPLLQKPQYFRTIYISSGIWQQIGWSSIIYLAALSAIDVQLYEAATIDGANKWKQTWHITLPGISSTIIILLVLRIGRLFTVGYEKIILMYNPSTYKVADVISTYVYRIGLLEFNWSYSTAVGLFNSIISFILLFVSNKMSKKYSETSLW